MERGDFASCGTSDDRRWCSMPFALMSAAKSPGNRGNIKRKDHTKLKLSLNVTISKCLTVQLENNRFKRPMIGTELDARRGRTCFWTKFSGTHSHSLIHCAAREIEDNRAIGWHAVSSQPLCRCFVMIFHFVNGGHKLGSHDPFPRTGALTSSSPSSSCRHRHAAGPKYTRPSRMMIPRRSYIPSFDSFSTSSSSCFFFPSSSRSANDRLMRMVATRDWPRSMDHLGFWDHEFNCSSRSCPWMTIPHWRTQG